MAQNDISIIASRVESLEGRLDDNIDKINSRLDLIVDLMQKVTALQEREINNQVQINEIKLNMREMNQTLKDWNEHIHERMDRHYTEVKVCRDGIHKTIEGVEDEIVTKLGKIETKATATQEELAKWLNRGIGAWTLASILIIVIQGLGAYVISGIIDTNSKKDDRMTRIEQRVLENERTMTSLEAFAKDQHGFIIPATK